VIENMIAVKKNQIDVFDITVSRKHSEMYQKIKLHSLKSSKFQSEYIFLYSSLVCFDTSKDTSDGFTLGCTIIVGSNKCSSVWDVYLHTMANNF